MPPSTKLILLTQEDSGIWTETHIDDGPDFGLDVYDMGNNRFAFFGGSHSQGIIDLTIFNMNTM